MIFISYAREDYDYASKLYLALIGVGLKPWMDKPPPPHERAGLRIGQRWAQVLDTQLRRADQIVLVLSPKSVSKRGFVRREFRIALDLMNELPDDQTLVFPVVAEDCSVPSLTVGTIDLRDIHWERVPEAEMPAFASQMNEVINGKTP